MDTANPVNKKISNRNLIGLIIILTIAVIAAFLWWWNYRKYISTDDANLDSYRVHVAARIIAPMTALYAWEGDTVKAGMLLAELDSSNVKAQLQEAIARRDQMVANLRQEKENLHMSTANLQLAQIAFDQAGLNYKRAKTQYNGQAIPQETFQNMEEAYHSAQVKVDIAKRQIDVAQAQVAAGEAAITAADASIESVRVNLGYCRITAPTDGVIAKRWSLPGDIVQPGQTLFTINEGKDIWVSVYLEETKFQSIRLGQPATFTLDAYPELTFSGKLYYIGSNAASEFALIPPNNASGNYTKIAQRVPLKISIEEVSGKSGKHEMPKLVSGMSATVKIKKEKE